MAQLPPYFHSGAIWRRLGQLSTFPAFCVKEWDRFPLPSEVTLAVMKKIVLVASYKECLCPDFPPHHPVILTAGVWKLPSSSSKWHTNGLLFSPSSGPGSQLSDESSGVWWLLRLLEVFSFYQLRGADEASRNCTFALNLRPHSSIHLYCDERRVCACACVLIKIFFFNHRKWRKK